MANQEHVEIVKQGVEAIEKWRKEHPCEVLNLSHADISHADISGSDLSHAVLSYADLSHAVLSYAYLSDAVLSYADLSGSYLSYAYLSGSDISHANLSHAVLKGAYISNAVLEGVNLSGFSIVPAEGSFVCYKKLVQKRIAKLFVTEDAKRLNSLVSRKIRVSKCKVLAIYAPDGTRELDDAAFENKTYEKKIQYQAGKIIEVDDYNDDIRIECAPGIHCFLTRKEAEEW